MDAIRHFKTCNVAGEGEFISLNDGRDNRFTILDMSASGVMIHTARELAEGDNVYLNMRLAGYVTEVVLKAEARVGRKTAQEHRFHYELKFTNLLHKHRIEVDEFIRHSCKLGHHVDLNPCEYGNCKLF